MVFSGLKKDLNLMRNPQKNYVEDIGCFPDINVQYPKNYITLTLNDLPFFTRKNENWKVEKVSAK